MRLLILIPLLLPLCRAQTLRYSPVERPLLLERATEIPSSHEERLRKIKEMFVDAGCSGDNLSEQTVDAAGTTNVICRLEGDSDKTILVGANYDQESPENWNGVSLLPSLYQALEAKRRRHTFLFVAFANETGAQSAVSGSRLFAGKMSKAQVDHAAAMVDLRALGFSPTKVWLSHSDKELVKALVVAMYALRLPFSQVELDSSAGAPSDAFASLRIPQITLHSLTREAVEDLREKQDPPVQFRPDNFYDSYHLICGYLVYLDETLKTPVRRKLPRR
ncbi:MAG TPA: hypothetical protein VKZ53_14485 [Candidatus Angelobacter sp.]|nr:hypothetical protein [Candidatus Angelobacter sp.]